MALQNPVLDIFLDGQILAPTSPFHLLVSDAYRYFLAYPRAIKHLAKMTLESSRTNIDLDGVEERVQDIKKYLSTHFPAVGLKTLTRAYGSTPMPESYPGYGSPEYFFLNLSSIERQTWRLQFYLHTKLYSLFTRARTTTEKRANTKEVPSPHLSEIASGLWDHISTLSLQPTPSYLAQAHTRISHSQIPRNYPPSSPSSTAVTPEDNIRTVINPDTFSLSSTGDTNIKRRVEEMMVSVRALTGRPDLVANIPQSSGLAPGEKR
ncbi:hypothetical protein CY34DRAFT_13900 [Suillus luteus UH-Slu-Lm8-n1]|uniref:Uncharacterized protein n=1 Tax=Suillus luteus UH-Slu-Lm8-n1 TaxID=930992 RepID=A0A0D0B0U4_9AGAM|nr:hypothetical protein CY34DRAFT_13900 [Suillus luteus UH-Slu-Lm8-n1]